MKGPCGVQWGSRGEAPESSCVFQCRNNIFNANLYRHKIVNIGLAEDFQHGGAQTTASETSRPSACARRSRGSRGLAPWRGLQGAAPPCVRKFCIWSEGAPHGSRGLAPWRGLQGTAPPCVRKFCILQAKYKYFQALCGLNLQKYMIWGLQGGS